MVYLLSFLVFAAAVLGMCVSVVSGRRPIQGSCGGLNRIAGLEGSCGACGERCKKKTRRQLQ